MLASFLLTHSAHSFALGDLLMSTEQRARIDLMRSKGYVPPIEKETPANSLQLNGFFFNNRDQRESGTIWVDGKQLKDKQLNDNLSLKKINEADKTVSIQLKETGNATPLKAGQKLLLQDGNIQDAYQ
jgi:hypothetical protein